MSTNSDYPTHPTPPSDGVEGFPLPAHSTAPEPPNGEDNVIEFVSPNDPFADLQTREATAIPEPSGMSALLPTPGLGGALGWCVLFGLFAGLAAIPSYLFTKLVLADKSMPVMAFVSSSLATCFVAIALVHNLFGSHRRQYLAVRRISLLHLLLVILIIPPQFLLVAETVNWATQVLDPEQKRPSPDDHAIRHAEARLARSSSFSDLTEKMYREMAVEPWWLILLAGCLLPAVGEEAFCRGFLGRGLVGRYGVIVGIPITALLFGLLHIEPVRICAMTVAGIVLHIVYLTTRSYWAPVLLHALHNGLVFATMRLAESRKMDITGMYGDEHLPPVLVAAAGFALLALLLLLYRTRTRWVLADGQVWSPGYVSAEMPPVELAANARLGSPGQAWAWSAVVVYSAFTIVAVVEVDPGTPRTAWSYNERGNQRLAREEFDAAISDYTEAIRLDSRYAWAYANRGLTLIKKERYAEAIPDLDQAIGLDRSLADAYLNRGIAHHQLGHHDLAFADYAQVLRLKPDDMLALHNRGVIYFLKGEDDRAIADFTAVLEHEPANADACLQRGHAYLIKHRWQEAVRDLSAAVRLEPKNADAYYLRSFARESQGDKAGAEADRREAERIDPGIAAKFR
ncbi:MAG TPA: tetratricopeptide repeat protein [Gemmataceae bacterium]|jgi:tetratricopeptide (TPR) repeat protein